MSARTNQQTLDAIEAVRNGMPVKQAQQLFGVHRSTIWRALRRNLKRTRRSR